MCFILLLTIQGVGAADYDVISGYFHPGGMYEGYAGHHSWINYCPLCHHYGTLTLNPKGTSEGEITCCYCDADYDGCTGYDKYEYGARARLERYVPEPEPVVVVQQPVTPWQHAHTTYTTHTML